MSSSRLSCHWPTDRFIYHPDFEPLTRDGVKVDDQLVPAILEVAEASGVLVTVEALPEESDK